MFSRRRFLVQTGSTLAITLGAAQLAQAASVAPWLQQQGGSQDMQTGLVWLDWTWISSWTYTHKGALDQAAASTVGGYTDWRLATRAEMKAAVSHQISQNCPMVTEVNGQLSWWSSTVTNTKGGKGAYAIDLRTGIEVTYLISDRWPSFLYTIFVRQGTL